MLFYRNTKSWKINIFSPGVVLQCQFATTNNVIGIYACLIYYIHWMLSIHSASMWPKLTFYSFIYFPFLYVSFIWFGVYFHPNMSTISHFTLIVSEKSIQKISPAGYNRNFPDIQKINLYHHLPCGGEGCKVARKVGTIPVISWT